MNTLILAVLLLSAVPSTLAADNIDPLVYRCVERKNCDTCLQVDGCGWCGDSYRGWCLPGNDTSSNLTAYVPDLEECPDLWWNKAQCGASYQATAIEGPYTFTNPDSNFTSVYSSVATWYIYNNFARGTGQIAFSLVVGVTTTVINTENSLLVVSNKTIRAVTGDIASANPEQIIGNVTAGAVGAYIDLVAFPTMIEFQDEPQQGWTCSVFEEFDNCSLVGGARQIEIDFRTANMQVASSADLRRTTISVQYQTIANFTHPSLPLSIQLDIWNASEPAVQADSDIDFFSANFSIRLNQYIFPTNIASLAMYLFSYSVFSEHDFFSQAVNNISSMNVSEADPDLLKMQLQPGWIENRGIYGPSEPAIRTHAFTYVQSKATQKKRADSSLAITSTVKLQDSIPGRNFATLLSSSGKKKSKAGVIAGATCAGVFVLVVVVAAVLIFKFKILRSSDSKSIGNRSRIDT